MLLRHFHLPGLSTYAKAATLQDNLVRAFLAHKADPTTKPPSPTILTAEFHPVYTCGRREVGSVTEDQIEYLTSPTAHGRATFEEALRGGQTTFHGPGQLVAYPILDLKRHGLSARCYVQFLEDCVMRTCAWYGVETQRTEHPGVWVDEMKKICAVGVHLRRNVSSHGIGLNASTETTWFDRIVACGLEGKGTTTLTREGAEGASVKQVGEKFVEVMAEGLEGVTGLKQIDSAEELG